MAEDKHKDMTDAEEMRKVFEVLSEHIPRLLESVTKVLYTAQEGEKFGNSVAGFYKSLMAAGMSSKEAFELTKSYMDTISIGGMLKTVMTGQGHGDDGVGASIRAKIKREIEED